MIIFILFFISQALGQTSLTTLAEKSNWTRTGRASETEELCQNFAKTYPDKVVCGSYGLTPEGRKLVYLQIETKNQAPKETLWVQAGIHAGEIDGKDAVFWLLKDYLKSNKLDDFLKNNRMIFIPIVSLDGHERFGPHNRPNQIGPEEMGWRANAQNLNLNRDFAKIETPELRDLIKLWHRFDPLLTLDLHVTNGADFQPEVGLVVAPTKDYGTTELHHAGSELEESMMSLLTKKSVKAMPFYPDFEDPLNPLSGFSRYVPPMRFANGYWRLNKRLGVLVEAHSWKNYKTRVSTHRSVVESAIESFTKNAKKWSEASRKTRQKTESQSSIAYTKTGTFKTLEFPGYEYRVFESKVSGAQVIQFYPQKKQVWKLPFYEELKTIQSVKVPLNGYYVPAAEMVWLLPKLLVHNIKYEVLANDVSQTVEVFTASETVFATAPYEGRQTLKVKGKWEKQKRVISAGSLFIPIKDNHEELVVHLFDPESKDSFLAWGFLNAWFEQKEYMEDYVAEELAEKLLKDKKIKKDFEQKLKSDETFRNSSQSRWEFFYRLHPSWDKKFNVYPVMRR